MLDLMTVCAKHNALLDFLQDTLSRPSAAGHISYIEKFFFALPVMELQGAVIRKATTLANKSLFVGFKPLLDVASPLCFVASNTILAFVPSILLSIDDGTNRELVFAP